jgi:hypothetical protein
VAFDTNSQPPVGIAANAGHTTFTVASAGSYLVTVALAQGNTFVQVQVNGSAVGPLLSEFCPISSCGFSRILTLNAGDAISLLSTSGGSAGAGSGITIVRIA